MCRHLAWVGDPVTLASVMLEAPFSLLRQSYSPRHQDLSSAANRGFGPPDGTNVQVSELRGGDTAGIS